MLSCLYILPCNNLNSETHIIVLRTVCVSECVCGLVSLDKKHFEKDLIISELQIGICVFTLHLWKRCVGRNEDQTHDTKCVTVSSLVAIFVFIFHSSRYHLHCHHHHPSGVLADGFSFHSHTIVTFHNMLACCGMTFSRGN